MNCMAWIKWGGVGCMGFDVVVVGFNVVLFFVKCVIWCLILVCFLLFVVFSLYLSRCRYFFLLIVDCGCWGVILRCCKVFRYC